MHRSITHTLAADHWHFTPTRAARTWQRIQSDTLLTATPACVHAERAQLVQSDTLLTATPACVCAARAQLLQSNTLLTATPASFVLRAPNSSNLTHCLPRHLLAFVLRAVAIYGQFLLATGVYGYYMSGYAAKAHSWAWAGTSL
jgi:hypothetical protein